MGTKKMFRLFLLSFLLLASCQRAHLWVRTELINESYLAATRIEATELYIPCFCREQLVISYRSAPPLATLSLSIRLPDQRIEHYSREIRGPSGYWLYRPEEPLLGYKVVLHEGERVIATFYHLWAEPIEID